MRHILILVALFIVQAAHAQFTRASITASGLTCSMCNNAINKALKNLPFVASVTANIKESSFIVSFREDVPMDIDQLKKSVENAGFSVAKMQLTGNFDRVKIKNDEHVEIGGRYFHFIHVTEQVLEGERTITIVDRNFLPAKEFKKLASETQWRCLQNGKMEYGSEKDKLANNGRVYHVTI
jgi:copper chaperone CopZ